MDKLFAKYTGKTKEKIAMEELCDLSLKLNQLNIKISGELLLDYIEYYKEHKFVLSENGISGVMQNKFINIPVYNDGDIYEIQFYKNKK